MVNHVAGDVLSSTAELDSLSHQWLVHNRNRIWAKKITVKHVEHHCIPPADVAPAKKTYLRQLHATKTSPFSLQSSDSIVASRLDLPSAAGPATPSRVISKLVVDEKKPTATGPGFAAEEQQKRAMSVIENRLIMSVCDCFLKGAPPYYASQTDVFQPDVAHHSCCACVTTAGIARPRRVHLPISAPSLEQIAKCNKDECYNKNVLMNLTGALSRKKISVSFSSLTGPKQHGIVHMQANTRIEALGGTKCCEELLFGACRTTCSDGFNIDNGVGSVYADAVVKYQQYANVSVGEHVTLTPTFHGRTPMVVSMSCPALNMSQVVTGVSPDTLHPKFGPSHPTQVVDVLRKLAPFVTKCADACLRLPVETADDIRQNNDMPVAASTSVDHCFAQNQAHGLSAYVATHVFTLPLVVLQGDAPHRCGDAPHAEHQASTTPPVVHRVIVRHEQKITVHVAALFGGASVATEI